MCPLENIITSIIVSTKVGFLAGIPRIVTVEMVTFTYWFRNNVYTIIQILMGMKKLTNFKWEISIENELWS